MDWAPILHRNAQFSWVEAFEDELVPDAFGLQLLGPGYAGRVPGQRDWITSGSGSGSVVLAHESPDAWFERSFAPFGGHRSTPTDPADVPEVLARAREDFAEILFRDEVAAG
jgi:hypothetical protein